ncbi:MAG: cytochrome c biogenesis protein CcsA [Euryarchaeota archaeon]|jgi:heme exporter protein C|nr:cytochrome c biogenesis protein CcsA [Euryarchaeota archaeon]MBT5661250.1 cytochrome c biogenesis protein CcsA [Euryarchaeota archaeon]
MKMKVGEALLLFGFIGIATTMLLAFLWAPSVSINAFESPAAQRIFYWHVPSAWAAFIAFGALFVGSVGWMFKRSELMWRIHIAGSEAGLATGLMTVWSGCVWGAAEWGTPWDWSDVRLNTFGLLTLLAIYLVLGRNSQPDGVETRDTFAAFGLYGFILVPFTYVATRIWSIRHPGPVIGTDDGGSLNADMGLILLFGTLSFTLLIFGHMLTSMRITSFEQRIEALQIQLDGGK